MYIQIIWLKYILYMLLNIFLKEKKPFVSRWLTDIKTYFKVRWFNGRHEMLSRGYKMVRYNKQMKVEKPGFGEFELNILKLTRRFADTYKCRTTNGTILSEVTVALERTWKSCMIILFITSLTFVFCEYVIYYVLFQSQNLCSWISYYW
jgi:hypothetical protein